MLAPSRAATPTVPTPLARLRDRPDSDLVRLVRAGSDPAFQVVVERYGPPLRRYCARLIDAVRAEDVVQQTFLNALLALRRDDREIDLRPWLYRIAHNLSLNIKARRAYDEQPLSEDFDGVPQPPEVAEGRTRFRAVVSSMASLPARQRSALIACELEGLSYAEIADRLDSSEQVVRGLIARARASVRRAAAALIPWPLLRWLPGGWNGNASTAVESSMTRAAGIAHVTVAAALTGTLAIVGVHAATSSKPERLTRTMSAAGQSGLLVPAGMLPAPDQAFASPFASPATGGPVSANPQAPGGGGPAAPGAQSGAPAAASPAESQAAANTVQGTAEASGAGSGGTASDPNAMPADGASVDASATPVDPNASAADPTATDPTAAPPSDQAPTDTSGSPPPDTSSGNAPPSDATTPTDTTPTDTSSVPADATTIPLPDPTSTP
jgi:RNA polymerase sigma factor (sigma-70 family)